MASKRNPMDLFELALASEGVTGPLADLARSIYYQESRSGKNTTTSNAGAVGGMQIIPGTFAQMADKGWDIHNPEHNARAGIRYIQYLGKMAGGDPYLTAAGYYGGPGAMQKARRGQAVSDPRNPNAPNTLQYAQQVVGRLPGLTAAPGPAAQVRPIAPSPPVNQAPQSGSPDVPPRQVAQGPAPEQVWQQIHAPQTHDAPPPADPRRSTPEVPQRKLPPLAWDGGPSAEAVQEFIGQMQAASQTPLQGWQAFGGLSGLSGRGGGPAGSSAVVAQAPRDAWMNWGAA